MLLRLVYEHKAGLIIHHPRRNEERHHTRSLLADAECTVGNMLQGGNRALFARHMAHSDPDVVVSVLDPLGGMALSGITL